MSLIPQPSLSALKPQPSVPLPFSDAVDIQDAASRQQLSEPASAAGSPISLQDKTEGVDLRTPVVEISSTDQGLDEEPAADIQEAASKQLLSELGCVADRTMPPQHEQEVHGLEAIVVKSSNDNRSIHEEPQIPGFFRLPVEIRMIIYKMCLVPDGKPALQSPAGARFVRRGLKRRIRLCDNGIIQTCRLIYEEAISIFYACNKFTYYLTGAEIGQGNSTSSSWALFRRNLRRMRQVRVHTCLDLWDKWYDDNTDLNVDRKLGYFLSELQCHCREGLRTLSIDVLWYPTPLLGECISSSIIREMLPHLQCLAVVGYRAGARSPYSIEAFCLAIADCESWEKTIYRPKYADTYTINGHFHGPGLSEDSNSLYTVNLDLWQISKVKHQDVSTES